MMAVIIATRIVALVIVIAPILWSHDPDLRCYCRANNLEAVLVVCTNLSGPHNPNFRPDWDPHLSHTPQSDLR
jgi:hypothetical protein